MSKYEADEMSSTREYWDRRDADRIAEDAALAEYRKLQSVIALTPKGRIEALYREARFLSPDFRDQRARLTAIYAEIKSIEEQTAAQKEN